MHIKGTVKTMKKRITSIVFYGAVILFAVLLVLFSDIALSSAKNGVKICLEIIIPSLFPFFVFSSLFVSTGAANRLCRVFGKLLPRVFGVSGVGALPLILGFAGGYPIGSKTVSELYASKRINKKEAHRLLFFACNTGPAFILGAVGTAVFQSITAGMILYLSHILSALTSGVICRVVSGDVSSRNVPLVEKPLENPAKLFTGAVTGAFASILNVCAFVIIFSVISGFFIESGCIDFVISILGFLGLDPVKCRPVIIGFFEMASGVVSLKDMSADICFALPAAGFILGWGGLSVQCQSISFTSEAGLSSAPFFFGKLLHGVLAALLTWLFVSFSGIQPAFSFTGHPTVKSFILDYIGLFYSAACALAGGVVLVIAKLKNGKN